MEALHRVAPFALSSVVLVSDPPVVVEPRSGSGRKHPGLIAGS